MLRAGQDRVHVRAGGRYTVTAVARASIGQGSGREESPSGSATATGTFEEGSGDEASCPAAADLRLLPSRLLRSLEELASDEGLGAATGGRSSETVFPQNQNHDTRHPAVRKLNVNGVGKSCRHVWPTLLLSFANMFPFRNVLELHNLVCTSSAFGP